MTNTCFDTAKALQPRAAAALSAQMGWPWDDRDRKREPLRAEFLAA